MHPVDMKKALLTLAIITCGMQTVIAQKGAIRQVYAWQQQVLSGVRPQEIVQEHNNSTKTAAVSAGKSNLLIYTECIPHAKIKWSGVWINGVLYKVKAETISAIPVLSLGDEKDGNRMTKELVPENAGPFIQLLPSGNAGKTGLQTGWFRQMKKSNELIIVYIYMGKTWYYPVPKIKVLEPVPAS